MSQSLNHLYAVVLAAGESARLGRPKQLVQWQGKSLVRRATEVAQAVAGAGVTIVTGALRHELETELSTSGARLIHNPDWKTGMGSSLRTGLQTVPPSASAVLIMLCDQPLLTVESLEKLTTVWQQDSGHPVAAAYADVLGVPAIIPQELLHELTSLEADAGAGRWLRSRDDVRAVALPAAGLDLDTPADLEELQRRE